MRVIFRKICGMEDYVPIDYVSELTEGNNDEGWEICVCRYAKRK